MNEAPETAAAPRAELRRPDAYGALNMKHCVTIDTSMTWHATKTPMVAGMRNDLFDDAMTILKEQGNADLWRLWVYGA